MPYWPLWNVAAIRQRVHHFVEGKTALQSNAKQNKKKVYHNTDFSGLYVVYHL